MKIENENKVLYQTTVDILHFSMVFSFIVSLIIKDNKHKHISNQSTK